MIFDLPIRSGWDVDIKTNNGIKISRIRPEKDFKTKDDVETYINYQYGITKADCVKYEICPCCY